MKNTSTESILIYGLYDPLNGELRYVGKTSKSLPVRLARHLRDRHKSYKSNWIKCLKAKNLVPCIRELERTNEMDWQQAEQRVIRCCLQQGARLTNLDSGGRGGHTVTKTVRDKMRQAQLKRYQRLREHYGGIAASPETRAKLSQNAQGHSWNCGWKHTQANRELFSHLAQNKKAYYRALKLGKSVMTKEGRKRLSLSRRKSSSLFELSDVCWQKHTNKEIATKTGATTNTVTVYRWRNKKPKYKNSD